MDYSPIHLIIDVQNKVTHQGTSSHGPQHCHGHCTVNLNAQAGFFFMDVHLRVHVFKMYSLTALAPTACQKLYGLPCLLKVQPCKLWLETLLEERASTGGKSRAPIEVTFAYSSAMAKYLAHTLPN